MDPQHVNVKLLVENPGPVDLARLIPVFHAWIQDQVFDGLLLDVADYRHVPAGPGVVLIGHQGNFSLDNTDNRLGVRYNRKAPLDGSNQDRLRQAAVAALAACGRLETEPRLEGKIRFDGTHIELFFNDRLLTANGEATRQAIQPDLEAFLGSLFGGASYALANGSDPRRLFSVSVTASRAFSTTELLANLRSASAS